MEDFWKPYAEYVKAEFYFADTYVDWAVRLRANATIIRQATDMECDFLACWLKEED